MRLLAVGKSSYQFTASYEVAPGMYNRVTVATASNTPKFTKSGKKVTISGVHFMLTPEAQTLIKARLGETVPMTEILFDTNVPSIFK